MVQTAVGGRRDSTAVLRNWPSGRLSAPRQSAAERKREERLSPRRECVPAIDLVDLVCWFGHCGGFTQM
eukprot:349929-Chlamydomonas_euryale.AAC.21